MPIEGLQLRSLVTAAGEVEISLIRVPVSEPSADEVVVRVDATPINPSDLGLLFGAADMITAKFSGSHECPVVTATIPPSHRRAVTARVGQSLPVGNEGAGVVVKAGSNAQHLLGKTVAMMGGAMYAQYRSIAAADCLVLPEGTSAAEGAACFINPLTALGMVETMRCEGHTALVHTAAASNLGQMLNRLCQAEGIALVNIVRKPAQEQTLRAMGAAYVCDTSQPTFSEDLLAAITATDATLGFDAIGGGNLAGQILAAMEINENRKTKTFNRYGSSVHKQVYIYGFLGGGPIELNRGFGMAWGVGGWLLPYFLQKIGPVEAEKLRHRVAREIKTTFASHYTRTVSLAEVLQRDMIAAYAKLATSEKFLINPNLGV